jgi:demethylmenaquinone methyltransferase/2-methoxy-6-polyprenyl-1,4-benzoquinol methylase
MDRFDAFSLRLIPDIDCARLAPMLPSGRMANRFYQTGDQRAVKVGDLFAAIAPRYDLINDLQSFGLHRWWKRRLVRLARVRPDEQALDLCCGTGDVAFALAKQCAHVVGLDFSAPMLAIARQRTKRKTKNNLRPAPRVPRFTQGDATGIPFPDNSFDVVTISYGLRNLSSLELGLREMRRVARPGGRLLALDFGKPDNAPLRSVYFAYLKFFVPMFGKVFCGDAGTYAYILESLNHYPAQQGVAAAMRAMKCANVRVCNLLGGIMSIHYGEKS